MSDPDSDPEAAAMAAAMGFSSFGALPAKKKRKFNPVTDAFVEGSALDSIHRGGKKGKGSGGNNVPLGKQRVFGTGVPSPEVKVPVSRANEDEIDLDLDDDDEEGGGGGNESEGGARLDQTEVEDEGPRYLDTSLPPPIEGGTDDDDDGPAYMDTSLPPPIEDADNNSEAAEMQSRIDRILNSIQPPPSNEITPQFLDSGPPGTTSSSIAQGSIHSFPPPGSGNLPARPAFQAPNLGFGGRERGGRSDAGSISSAGRSRGERNPEWYVGYYDPSFNENPWEKLEKERGLPSVGTWVDRPRRDNQ